MNTNNQITSNDLRAKINRCIEELAEATDIARMSEEMQRYLDTCAKFHKYSMFNVIQILMTKPDATAVAGFKKWQCLGRYVRKGEHGIPILAPIFSKVTDEDGKEVERLIGFKVVFVFDVCQTEGAPLPEPPNWKSPEKNLELQERLMRFAESKGISVKIKHFGRDIQGVSIGGKIVLDPEAGTKTLIHEIAHEMLHQCAESFQTNSVVRELEAEGIAYVVAKHFGLNSLASPNYIALHGVTAELIMEHLERIRTTATMIIQALETEFEPVC
jgi:N-terminal domain of anti-restriction factor ArdC